MNESLLDTDIFSEIVRGKNPPILLKASSYQTIFPRFSIAMITVMEVVKGYHHAQREARLQLFVQTLHGLNVVPFSQETAVLAGRIYGDLERTGQTIGRADPMIAATALQHNLTLVTGNTTHYQRIQALGYALTLDNWRE